MIASRFDYRRVFEAKQGKHHALNAALATVTTPLVVTVDADTHVQPQSLTRLVVRVTSAPQGQHVSACAAALVAENPLATFVTRMQQWDYRLGINGVKRMQAAYNTALVAQGAFSAYWTSDLRAVGGWPDAIGEDIVLTWTMLGTRGIVQYEPVALGFTVVPERLRSPPEPALSLGTRDARRPSYPSTAADSPASSRSWSPGSTTSSLCLDIGVIFFWVPGVILFLFGYPLIFGWWSMLLLPITLAVFGFLQRWQARHVFRTLDIHPQSDKRGFLGYLFAYQVLTSAAALRGYGQYIARVGSPLEVGAVEGTESSPLVECRGTERLDLHSRLHSTRVGESVTARSCPYTPSVLDPCSQACCRGYVALAAGSRRSACHAGGRGFESSRSRSIHARVAGLAPIGGMACAQFCGQ